MPRSTNTRRRRHHRSHHTQQPRSSLSSLRPRTRRTDRIILCPEAEKLGIDGEIGWSACVLAPVLRCCAEYRPRTTHPYPNTCGGDARCLSPSPSYGSGFAPPNPLATRRGPSRGKRELGSFPMKERMATASSSWTCLCFREDALRYCRVCSHLCLFKQFG